MGILILEWSSNVLEFSNDAYATLSRILEYCKLIGWLENNEKATFNINTPYFGHEEKLY